MKLIARRAALVVLSAGAVMTSAFCGKALAQADDYPARPIRMIVPWPAGGASDIIGRLIGSRLGELLGQPVIVDNRAGANGQIGTAAASKAAPDGYTLIFVTSSTHSVGPSVTRKMPYDPVKDFASISRVAVASTLLVVPPQSPFTSVSALITHARANPARLDYASYGIGSAAHLAAELFAQTTDVKLTHIPYQGTAPASQALLGGQVALYFDSMASAMPLVKAGKLRALASTGTQRVLTAPEIPTVAESVPGFDVSVWWGIQAPVGTPAPIITKLHAATVKVVAEPAVRQRLVELGTSPGTTSPEEFASYVSTEKAKWDAVVRKGAIPISD